MQKITLILVGILFSFQSFSQEFKGQVLDQETNLPIPYAEIYIVDFNTGHTSNENGEFTISHYNQTNITIHIHAMGYETLNSSLGKTTSRSKTFYLIPSHFDLEEIVLSIPKGKLESSTTVNITQVKLKELQQTAPISLAEAISQISGVSQNTTGAGIGKPVIRGLSGNRIVTFSQGVRVENQQWGSEHGLGVGAIGIESVEVIKGPASLLYGSDALGGVLYFKDARYAQENTLESFIGSTYLSNTNAFQNIVGLKLHKNELKLNVFASESAHSDYKTAHLGRVLNTRFDEKNLKTSLGFNYKNWISNLRYSYLENNFGISEDATYHTSSTKKSMLPTQNIANHSLSFDNSFFTGDSKLNLILGYSSNYRREFEDDKNLHALGLKLNSFTYNANWTSPVIKSYFDIVLGIQGMTQDNKNNGKEILIPDATTTDSGAFFLGNYSQNNLELQGGIRVDSRRLSTSKMSTDDTSFPAIKKQYSGVTFSLGGIYTLKNLKLRGNISSGFRAPNSSELLSNGVHEGSNRFEKGNSYLKSEKAIQIDFSATYQNEHFKFSINPFYNRINNYIYLAPTGNSINMNPVYEYLQTNAFLYGGELGFHYHPHSIHWLHVASNLSAVYAEDSNNNALPLIPQTTINTTLSAEFKGNSTLVLKNIFIKHQYKFKQDKIGIFETISPNYNLLDIGCQLAIHTKNKPVEIKLGVKNVFNKSYIDHLSRFKEMAIPNQGINYYLGLKFNLQKSI
ncbi:MAG: TonB-dependent receptor [Flavobacteriaceae bacterium]|nr:MAG: TonB-dependent receptor [Flavobacteriaceae bacterium]